ncbi:MAG: histidine--tRNA ligase [Solirubrobacteraceae bacterium]
MAQGLSTPRGTVDVLPDEAGKRDRIVQLAADLFGAAGYRHIDTPIFESTELFKRGVGGSTDIVRKEMYSFEDNGGREITLRPEGTASVARAYVQHGMQKLPQPVKLWYSGPFFRYERPQAGRQRQFAQLGAEVLGSDAPAVDAELIALLHQLLLAVGCQGVRLRLGSLGSIEARASYRQKLQDYLRAHESDLSEDVVSRIDENPLRAFDADDPGTQGVMASAPLLLDELAGDDADHFAEVRLLLDAVGVPYEIDPTLVRGLDYYTRTVFEFTSDALGAQGGVGGGGRYDGLVEQLGGPATPGAGWAAGFERMLLAAGDRLEVAPRVVDLFVAAEDDPAARRSAFTYAAQLRAAGLRVEIDLVGRSTNAQLKAAAKLGARAKAVALADGSVVLDRERDTPVSAEELAERLTLSVPSDPTPQGATTA